MALTPAAAISSTLSANGKKASLASTAPSKRSLAWSRAIRTDATRLVWPGPTPSVMWSFVTIIPFDLTYLIAFQANSRAVCSCSLGWRFVTTFQSAGFSLITSWFCTKRPPTTPVYSFSTSLASCASNGNWRIRKFFFFVVKISSASSE